MKKLIYGSVLTLLFAAVVASIGCSSIGTWAISHHPKAKNVFAQLDAPRQVTGKGWLEYAEAGTNRIPVLHLEGTDPYSAGYYHGTLLAKEAAATIDRLLLGVRRMAIPKEIRWLFPASSEKKIVDEFLMRGWERMRDFTPREDLEEMEGLADGLKAAGFNISLETIHRVHAIPDLTEATCSALYACSKATADGRIYQLRILDYGTGLGLEEHPVVVVYHGDSKNNTVVNIGWTGFLGVATGANDKGVAISEMGYGDPPDETLSGIPMPFLLKQALRKGNRAKDVVEIIRKARRTNSYAYIVGDKSGDGYGMVTNARECNVFHINEHKEFRDKKEILPQFSDSLYAGHYGEKQGKIVKEMHGTLDIARIQEMTKQIAMKSNLHTVIFDLTSGDLLIANRSGKTRAADCTYVPLKAAAWQKTRQIEKSP